MKHSLLSVVCVVLVASGTLTVVHSFNRSRIEGRPIETPRTLEDVLALTRASRARFDYAGALRLLDDAARYRPNSADVLCERGAVFLEAEDLARARKHFEAALRVDASDAEAIIGLAAVDLLDRNDAVAETRLRFLLSRDQHNARALALLARLLLEKNMTSEAAAEAQRAIELDSSNVEALMTLAFVRARERKPAEVRALTRRVVSVDGYNSEARRLLSQYIDGRFGRDQRVSDEARKRYERGRELKRQGKMTEAVAEFEEALAVEPRYYRALLALGDVWLKEGDYRRAATAARLAESVDPDGALAQIELSCAFRGMKEQARIEIGAIHYAAIFDRRPAPPVFALTREIFPDYESLSSRQRTVVDTVVAPLAQYLPKLAGAGARHYLLAYDQRPGEIRGLRDTAEEKTLDDRPYDSLRGVGGRVTVSGIEYLDTASSGGANTIAHEFAHQVHLTAMSTAEVRTIHNLYRQARRRGRALDYYAAANELEYFAQGYEAFISYCKRPSAGITSRHTNGELLMRDPELYSFLVKLCGAPVIPGVGQLSPGKEFLDKKLAACDYPA